MLSPHLHTAFALSVPVFSQLFFFFFLQWRACTKVKGVSLASEPSQPLVGTQEKGLKPSRHRQPIQAEMGSTEKGGMGKTAGSVSSRRQPGYRLYSSKKGGTRNVEAHCWGNLRVHSVGRLCGSGSCGFGEPCRGVGKVFYGKQMDHGEATQGSSSKRGHRLDPL